MAIKEVVHQDGELERIFKAIEKRSKKAKERLNIKSIEETKVEPKKKEAIKPKKEYKSFMKVASIFVIFGLLTLLVACMYVPSVGDVIMAIIEAINPFDKFKGGNALDPTNFANFKKY